MNRHARLLLCALAVSVPAAPALGGGPDKAPTVEDLRRADELYRQASALLDAGKLPEARAKYAEAWELKQSYDIATNLGAVELALGDEPGAATHLRWGMRNFPVNGNPDTRKVLEQRYAEAKAASGTVILNVSVAGADITVDGKSIGQAPLPDEVYVEPGKRTFGASAKGYETATEVRDIAADTTIDVSLTLAASGPDGAGAGPGAGGGYPSDSGVARYVPAIALGATAVAAGAIGLGLRVAASGRADDAAARLDYLRVTTGTATPCDGGGAECDALDADLGAHDDLTQASVAMFVVGAAGLAGAGVALGVAASGAGGVAVIVPTFGPRTAGLTLVGSF
ncbi:MAG: PEGA domain-containing protein [Polyangiaceae bacterium]|nr:PEGA domain-containing protein [Polyangiaceae bacterium]